MKRMHPQPEVSARTIKRVQLDGELSPTQARALLKLHFSSSDMERIRTLSAKARAGTLSPDAEGDITSYEWLGCLLDLLHSKARRVLQKRMTAS